eukprot:scaffold260_cov328-Prasinococcus_capsulatus_cf.AAC.16
MPTDDRSLRRPSVLMSTPSTSMFPPANSTMRKRHTKIDDLPLPVRPTMPTYACRKENQTQLDSPPRLCIGLWGREPPEGGLEAGAVAHDDVVEVHCPGRRPVLGQRLEHLPPRGKVP